MAKRKKNKVGKIFSIILLIISLGFIGLLCYSNMLPAKYLIPIIIVFGSIDFVLFFLIRKKRLRKTPFIISILMIIIESLVIYYLLVTLGFLSSLMSYNYKSHTYNVIVLKSSNNKDIKDLNKKFIGYIDKDAEETKKALKELDRKIDYNKKDNNDVEELMNDLFEKNVDAVLIDEGKLSILLDDQPELEDQIKIIYTFTVQTKLKENKNDKTNVLKETFSIYVSGNDMYGEITNAARSDVNIIITVNVKSGKILITNIPRDYYVTLASKNSKDKLTHAGIYGIDESIKTIEKLLDTKINYYLKVNFTSVEKLVDVLGGIEIYSNYNFTSRDGYYYSKGTNYLDGKKALSFVRERYAFGNMGGDRIRGEHQILVIKEIIKKASTTKILTKYQSLLSSMEGNFATNFSEKNISKIVKNQLDKKTNWKVESYNLKGSDSMDYTFSYPSKKLYVMNPDEKSVKEAQDKIKEFYKK